MNRDAHNLPTSVVAQCAHRLREHWPHADVVALEETAVELWHDDELRTLSPADAASRWLARSNCPTQSTPMAQQRVLEVGDPVPLPSARVIVAAIPTRSWVAVRLEGQWAVRRDQDAAEWTSHAGLDETDARALVKLLNQVGVR